MRAHLHPAQDRAVGPALDVSDPLPAARRLGGGQRRRIVLQPTTPCIAPRWAQHVAGGGWSGVSLAACLALASACGGDGEDTLQRPRGSSGGQAASSGVTGGTPATGGVLDGAGGIAVGATGGGPLGGSSASGGSVLGGSSGSGGAAGSGGTTGGASGSGGLVGGTSGSGGASGGAVATGGWPPVECQGGFDAVDVGGAQYSVAVQTATSRGPLPHFWNTFGTGHLGLYLREDRGWGELLKAHTVDGVQNLGLTSLRQHGLFHDDLGIYREENGVPVYDFSKSDQVFDFFVDLGIEPIVELAPMPSALASDPSATVFDWGMGISPPKDFELWQDLVFQFVDHSVQRYGVDVVSRWYFEVWNEPECCNGKFWTGTLEQYFQLYDHTAAAVRAALPGGRVGGPVSSQPAELRSNSRVGELFLDHVTTDNYVNPGSPGILDFFTYHTWSFVDGSVNGYFQGIDLLDSYGLNDVRVAVTEFGPTYEFGLYDEPQESRQGAAFVAQTYGDIAQRAARDGRRFPITYSWWVLSDVFEEGTYREDDPFIGCMGLTSRENIHKPAYNVYRFLARMGNEQVAMDANGAAGVGGLAARGDDGSVQVLVYNAQNPGAGPFDGSYYEVVGPQEIGVTVSGLQPDLAYDVNAFRVDEQRGNAYATWENLGRPTMGAMSEADWQALRDTMDSPAEPLAQARCGETFTGSFSLPSPGVLFVELTPAAP